MHPGVCIDMLALISMDELNQEIDRILKHLDKERWIAFSKDDS